MFVGLFNFSYTHDEVDQMSYKMFVQNGDTISGWDADMKIVLKLVIDPIFFLILNSVY